MCRILPASLILRARCIGFGVGEHRVAIREVVLGATGALIEVRGTGSDLADPSNDQRSGGADLRNQDAGLVFVPRILIYGHLGVVGTAAYDACLSSAAAGL